MGGYTEDVRRAPLDETVCWCSGVSKRRILEAVSRGAETLDDVRRMTGACTVGRCRERSPRGRCCSAEIRILLEEGVSLCRGGGGLPHDDLQ